ncbi:unnamed protein product, partial [Prorocentrum cordatum]
MAINKIGDQVKSHLAGLFTADASSPAAKQAKKAGASEAADAGKRHASPSAIPFEKPQAKWLQTALGDTFAVFGEHIEERFVGIEQSVASMSAQVQDHEGKIEEALKLKETVENLLAELQTFKDAHHGMADGPAAPAAGGAHDEALIRKDMEDLRKQVEQQTTKMAEVPYEMRKVCICGGLGWDTPPETLQERCRQVLREAGLEDKVETVAATRDIPGSTCEVVLRDAGTMGPARLRVKALGKTFVANKKVWFDAKRSRAENAPARMMHKAKEYLEAAATRDRAVVTLTTETKFKQVKANEIVIGYASDAAWAWTPAATQFYAEEVLGLSADVALEALIHELEVEWPRWSIAFLAESDAHYNSSFSLEQATRHHYMRHWLGLGSTPFTVFVRDARTPHLKALKARGRCCREDFNIGKGTAVSIVMVHGGHGDELLPSLADATALAKARPRRSRLILIGDMNVDLLPTLPTDPFAGSPHWSRRHQEERMHLHSFPDSSKIRCKLHDIDPFTGNFPASPMHSRTASMTRMPPPGTTAQPSLIDHVASDGCVHAVRGYWTDFYSDHAAIAAYADVGQATRTIAGPSTWRCRDGQAAVARAKTRAPQTFQNTADLMAWVAQLQRESADSRARAARRSTREPLAVKELRHRARAATDRRQQQWLRRELHTARVTWLTTLRQIRQAQRLNEGKVNWKSKKILPLRAMQAPDGGETVDHQEWASMIEAEFRALLRCGNPRLFCVQNDFLRSCGNASITFSKKELADALAGLRHAAVIWATGIAVAALWLLYEARPDAVHKAFLDLARNQEEMGSLVILGRASAKRPGAIPPAKVPAILLLPVALAVVDYLLAKRVHDIVDRYAARALPAASISPYLECAKSRRQTLDAVHPLALVIEKGMGVESKGCACQQDVRKYYDAPRAVRVARAGAAGRIPLLDVASQRMHYWQSLGFEGTGLASFVDNLLAAPRDPSAAIRIQDDCAEQLSRRWNLQIGEDSREYFICKGGRDNVVSPHSWDKKEPMKTLGHIDNNGGITSCYAAATAAMLRAFFGNLDRGLRRANEGAKLRFLTSGVLSIVKYRFSRWPYQRTYASSLDRLQRKLLAITFDIRPVPNEDWGAIVLRRRTIAQSLAARTGRWSQAWAKAQASWDAAHVRRGHDVQAWAPRVLGYRGAEWLSWQRLITPRGQESR